MFKEATIYREHKITSNGNQERNELNETNLIKENKRSNFDLTGDFFEHCFSLFKHYLNYPR